jgi:membrane-associated phospholipid phosphatase
VGEWRIRATARELRRRLVEGWEATPGARRHAWGRTFGGGLVVALAVTVLSVQLTKTRVAPALADWESRTMARIDQQTLLSFNWALWLEGLGNGFVLWGAVLVAAGLAAWTFRPLLAASFLFGFGSLYLNVIAGWLLWDRERPTVVLDGIASPATLSGFPSGHVAQSVFFYGLVCFLWLRLSRRASERAFGIVLLLAVVAVVGVGRLRLGAHWPTDVVGGLVIGGVWTAAVALAVARGDAWKPRRGGGERERPPLR